MKSPKHGVVRGVGGRGCRKKINKKNMVTLKIIFNPCS
jgi:hypothetical protein